MAHGESLYLKPETILSGRRLVPSTEIFRLMLSFDVQQVKNYVQLQP